MGTILSLGSVARIPPDSTIETIVAAMVGYFDESAEKDVAPVDTVAQGGSMCEESVYGRRVGGGE
jgi:hypothetical protein